MRIVVHDYAGHPFQFGLSRELARRGHDVIHIFFSDLIGPKGQIERLHDDPASHRVMPISFGRPYRKTNFYHRVRDDRQYGAKVAREIRLFRPDVVISGNTPLDAQGAIIAATRAAGGRFVFWMQDYYSRAIRAIVGQRWGGLGRLVAGYYAQLERAQLQASDAVVLISADFRAPVVAMGIDPRKLHVIPNWGAIESVNVEAKRNQWSLRHGLSDRFVFLYSGTLGLKHDPALLLALGDHFAGEPDVVIVIAAQGQGRDRLDAELAAKPRANMITMNVQPVGDVSAMLATADVLVAILESEAGEFSVPSKVLSYLCAARPVLLSAPLANACARLVSGIGAGAVVDAADSNGFVAAAGMLRASSDMREAAGAAGRRHAEQNFRIATVADRFEAVLVGQAHATRRIAHAAVHYSASREAEG